VGHRQVPENACFSSFCKIAPLGTCFSLSTERRYQLNAISVVNIPLSAVYRVICRLLQAEQLLQTFMVAQTLKKLW